MGIVEEVVRPLRPVVDEGAGRVAVAEDDRLVLPAQAPEGEWVTDVWGPLDGRVVNGGVRLSF